MNTIMMLKLKDTLKILKTLHRTARIVTKFCHQRVKSDTIRIKNHDYIVDNWTNVTPRVLDKIGRNLHNQNYHPIYLIRKRIENYFNATFRKPTGSPLFAVFDNMNPVVTTYQNFDSLFVPKDHVSRLPSDTYYVNKDQMLRAHTSAHQDELMKMGFDHFLAVGDVYRRDAIDSSHYPVFHQMEGVRLFTNHDLFKGIKDANDLALFEASRGRLPEKQETHTLEAAKLMEHDLKKTLVGLAQVLFGQELEYRWVDAYFPFTHPSWELEIMFEGDWLEVLGCGIMEQKLLFNAGAATKIGWAFGLGLDRLAMKLYSIPDIRLFWSEDSGFLNQFRVDDPSTAITYKPISQYPQCKADVSFWITDSFSPNDFYDLVRNVAGDVVEEVTLIDEFVHPKKGRTSHCYRVVYRHMEKTFTQEEVNEIHARISEAARDRLNVELR